MSIARQEDRLSVKDLILVKTADGGHMPAPLTSARQVSRALSLRDHRCAGSWRQSGNVALQLLILWAEPPEQFTPKPSARFADRHHSLANAEALRERMACGDWIDATRM